MPQIKSAKKRNRQTKRRTERNKEQRSALRTALKKARQPASPGDAQLALQQAENLLDRAGRKRLIHPNAASRQKSRLRKALQPRG